VYFQSGGTLVRKGIDIVDSAGNPTSWPSWRSSVLGERWATYGEIYRSQLWVSVVVNKLAKAQARLPLKVYRRLDDGGRELAERDHPYAQLLRRPSSKFAPFPFYAWTWATQEVYGSAFWGKLRDAGGRPVELVLLHPAAMELKVDKDSGERSWDFDNGTLKLEGIPDHDVVHFHTYNPDDPNRGLSPLEPLRATLENEDSARSATTSFWENGARPGVALTHPGNLSRAAQDRLVTSWNAIAGGADKTGKTVVLEEGMKPEIMMLTAEEAQYIESRRLNREEVCAEYDVPPPVVHILDRATFSNITEQMRSMYRDTMAPRLGSSESTMEFGLRGSVRPGAAEPDFGDDVYAEYLLDEVLRGDFETRAATVVSLINNGQLTINEGRRMENRPPVEGGDVLLINAALVPVLPQPPELPAAEEPAPAAAEGEELEADEAAPVVPYGAVKALPVEVGRSVMGRLSRQAHPRLVDPHALVEGLNGHGKTVLAALTDAQVAGEDMAALRARIRALTAKEHR
jgi:HK97 family phage portal protein